VAFGLGALIAVSELAYNLLKYSRRAYLAWLGMEHAAAAPVDGTGWRAGAVHRQLVRQGHAG
jgi:threonine/homoserine/homoserine lactone efflux protein